MDKVKGMMRSNNRKINEKIETSNSRNYYVNANRSKWTQNLRQPKCKRKDSKLEITPYGQQSRIGNTHDGQHSRFTTLTGSNTTPLSTQTRSEIPHPGSLTVDDQLHNVIPTAHEFTSILNLIIPLML